MNAYPRTLPLVGGNGVTIPVRESGSSALDRRATWPAPDPSTIFDPWAAPAPHAVIRTVIAPWPAPDPSMRVELPAPMEVAGMSNLVEPFHPIELPDLVAARSVAVGVFAHAPVVPVGTPLPPPTRADAAERMLPAPDVAIVSDVAVADPSGVRRRLAIALAAAAGVACAAVAAAVAIL